jgi:hypothetical protein
MRTRVFVLLPLIACTGCVGWGIAPRLTKRAVNQVASDMDLRYEETLYNLAMIADEPTALPVVAPIYAGTPAISDNFSIGNGTTVQHFFPITAATAPFEGFSQDQLSPALQRQDIENWSLDPITVPEKLEALRAACQWEIYGPEFAMRDHPGLLLNPDEFPPEDRERHFNVANSLAKISPGWLHLERRATPPVHAAYRAHCRGMWAWVTPEGVEGLADFTLVMHNIARVSINSLTLFSLGEGTSPFSFVTLDRSAPYPKGQVEATVAVNPLLVLVPDSPYVRWRIEVQATNSALRTQISTAGLR